MPYNRDKVFLQQAGKQEGQIASNSQFSPGVCAGVVRAVEVVEICLERFGPPVYVKHQIVHNPYVVDGLEKKGAITVETVEEVPEGSLVVFSATARRLKTTRKPASAT